MSGTAVTVVTVDSEGEPTGPALLWMDTRAAAEAAEVTAAGHPCLWFAGGHVSPEWMLPQALWRRTGERSGAAGPDPGCARAGHLPDAGWPDSAASLARWFVTELGDGQDAFALDALAAAVPPGSDGVVALDTWQGSRTPHRDPRRRGGFTGLALGHGRAHLYRAILESVAYGGRQITGALAGTGTRLDELVLTGGGSRSSLWCQIHADVIGRPLLRLTQPLPAALGAPMCAAAGAGTFSSSRAAAAAMSRVTSCAEPDPASQAACEAGFRAYQHIAAAPADSG